jgi:predicted DNA-binding transcriptional regulator YafY
MTSALTDVFPHAVEIEEDEHRQRRWIIREVPLARLRLSGDEELEALEFAITRLRDSGDARQAHALASLRDRLLAALPVREARRAEADAEAMLEVHGVAARPGPIVAVDQKVSEAVTAALRGPYRLHFSYQGSRRVVEPYGVLLGARRYLVAKQPDKGPTLRHFRFDRIAAPEITDEWFARDEGFDLASHAACSFGSYHDDNQFGEVIWRFAPEAADRAAEWRFHPNQQTRQNPDGSLEVRFEASGWLEMAWHLYQWGDSVEVITPKGLADLVHAGRRADFDSLP